MQRREFLKAAAAAVAALPAEAAVSSSSRRHIFPMNRNWLFGGKTTPNATARDFDDRHFERVTIPHANVRLPWHSFDDKD